MFFFIIIESPSPLPSTPIHELERPGA